MLKYILIILALVYLGIFQSIQVAEYNYYKNNVVNTSKEYKHLNILLITKSIMCLIISILEVSIALNVELIGNLSNKAMFICYTSMILSYAFMAYMIYKRYKEFNNRIKE